MNKNIKLSVIVTSYNHEKYIAQAIDSVINQEVEFDFEIIIGDDFSTDNTRAILDKYAKQYPDLIHLILPDQNLGGGVIFSKALSQASGEYLAFLDGDDYWTSTEKLSRQFEFLQKNPECSLVFHNAIVKYESLSDLHSWELNRQDHDGFLNTREIIHFRSIQTSTMMVCRPALDVLANNSIRLHQMDDWMLALFASMHGPVGFMCEPMSVYFQHGYSEWSSLGRGDMCEKFIRRYELIRPYMPEDLQRDVDFEIAQLSDEASVAYAKSGRLKKASEALKRILSQKNSTWLVARAQGIGMTERRLRMGLFWRKWLYLIPLAHRIIGVCEPFRNSCHDIYQIAFRLSLRVFNQVRYGRVGFLSAYPNPAPSTRPSGLGITSLSWISSKPIKIEIRVDRLDGPIFHSGFGFKGTVVTGKWVQDNTCFFLMDASKPPGWPGVVDFICVKVGDTLVSDHELDQLISLSDADSVHATKQENINHLSRALEDSAALIEDLDRKIKQLSNQASDQRAALDHMGQQNDCLLNQMRERDNRIDELNQDIHSALATIAQQQCALKARDLMTERVPFEMHLGYAQVQSLKQQIIELEACNSDLQNLLDRHLSKALAAIAQQQITVRARDVIAERMLNEIHLGVVQNQTLQQCIIELHDHNSELLNLLDTRDSLIRSLNAAVSMQRQGMVSNQDQPNLVAMRQYGKQREKELKQLSDWAQHIHSRPLGYALRRHAYLSGRRILRALPLSELNKRRLSSWLREFSRPLRKVLGSMSVKNNQATESFVEESFFKSVLPCERNVFIFGVIDWHFRNQRPQQIAKSLSKKGWRVFYFSNHFIDDSQPGYQIEQLDADSMLFQVKLHVSGAPQIYFAAPEYADQLMLEAGVAKLINDFDSTPALMLVQHAYWYGLMSLLPSAIRAYDCMDHHEGFGNVPDSLVSAEEKIIHQADLVVVTSKWLEEFIGDKNRNVSIIRNGCDYQHFDPVPADRYVDAQGRRIIGYYGAIAEWFDLELVRAVAEKYHDHLILLVGNDTVNASSQLADLENVTFIGEVSYQSLPYYLYAFDLCLLPFKVIPLTLATNPVKVYEYLAAGKPVVCVELPEVADQFNSLVWRAASRPEFIEKIAEALQESNNRAEQTEMRKYFSAMQTWEHRVEELEKAVSQLRMPKISVIVLTYNNIDLSKACLQSVLKESNYPNLELIIVDNASTDGTGAWLKTFAIEHPDVKVIINSSNLGFAAGNNVGLAAATGEYLVLLNNDTVVTPNWLITLMHHLRDDSTIGLIGPVTNNIGNEARIDIAYGSMQEMKIQAARYARSHVGQIYPLKTAAFFCVMMHRSTYEKVGPLDEAFGRGFFEDDDYCRRIESVGMRVVCAEDVFIHHHLSASFNKLMSSERQALFDRNKAIYEAKWGEWTPHSYRPEYYR